MKLTEPQVRALELLHERFTWTPMSNRTGRSFVARSSAEALARAGLAEIRLAWGPRLGDDMVRITQAGVDEHRQRRDATEGGTE